MFVFSVIFFIAMRFFVIVLFFIPSSFLIAQDNPTWDDAKTKEWPEECRKVEIISSLDQKKQPAYFYSTKSSGPKPLIVSLHTWSGGYDQKDSLSWDIIRRDFNYIHPHFRGPNNTPEACGSTYAIQDIDDAIEFAIQHGNVDTTQIHITGASGGGYATLLAYMKTRHRIKTFSAWVPISNLEDWYYESVGRGKKYARDIAMATTNIKFGKDDYYLNKAEARSRSPFYMPTPIGQRKGSKLYIYAGIHDGYKGSVPITQSLKFYNKVVSDFDSTDSRSRISTEEMLSLVERRNSSVMHPSRISKGDIHFQRSYLDKVQLAIFEGSHERLSDLALAPMEGENILTIGDSNGAHKEGWVNQLRKRNFGDFIYNKSVGGNTIGFDNNGDRSKNTLRLVDEYLESAADHLNGLGKIVIMLGTNDCKAIFNDSLRVVPKNMTKLIRKIKAHEVYTTYHPDIYILSPPPCSSDDKMKEKYHGSREDIAWLVPRFKKIAKKEGCEFIDTYSELLPQWDQLTLDGIHLTEKGHQLIAETIEMQW